MKLPTIGSIQMSAGRVLNTATLPEALPHVIFTGREQDDNIVDKIQKILLPKLKRPLAHLRGPPKDNFVN